LPAAVINPEAPLGGNRGHACVNLRQGSLRIGRQRLPPRLDAECRAELPDRLRQRRNPAVEQEIGQPGLRLRLFREIDVARVDGAHIEHEVRTELSQCLRIDLARPPRESAELGQACVGCGDVAAVADGLVSPAEENLWRHRIEQGRRGRTRRKDPADMIGNLDPSPGGVHDRARVRRSGQQEYEQREPNEADHGRPGIAMCDIYSGI
jgi:hypothetical protein